MKYLKIIYLPKTLVLNGATAIKTVDESFNELDKKELKVVYQDGKDAVLVPSSYEGEVSLTETTLDDLFNLEITSVYQYSSLIIIKYFSFSLSLYPSNSELGNQFIYLYTTRHSPY